MVFELFFHLCTLLFANKINRPYHRLRRSLKSHHRAENQNRLQWLLNRVKSYHRRDRMQQREKRDQGVDQSVKHWWLCIRANWAKTRWALRFDWRNHSKHRLQWHRWVAVVVVAAAAAAALQPKRKQSHRCHQLDLLVQPAPELVHQNRHANDSANQDTKKPATVTILIMKNGERITTQVRKSIETESKQRLQ